MEEMNKVLEEQTPEGTPKKSNKTMIYGIIGACVVLFIGIFAFLGMGKGSSVTKEAVVTDSMLKLVKGSGNTSGIQELSKALVDEGGNCEVSLKIEQMVKESEEDIDLTGWGIRYQVKSNSKEQKSGINLALTNQNVDFLAADVLYDMKTKRVKAAVPALFSNSFLIDLQDGWQDKLKDSYLAKELGLTPETVKPFEDYMSQSIQFSQDVQKGELFNFKEIKERFEKTVQVRKTFESEIKVTDLKEKSFSVKGKDLSCTGYKVVVPADTVLKLWAECKDFLLKDEELKKSMDAYFGLLIKAAEMQESPEAGQIFSNMQSDLEKNLNQATEDLEKNLRDIQMELYLNKENEIISLTAKMPKEGEKGSSWVELLRKGGTTLSENMTISFLEEIDGVRNGLILDKEGKTENNVQDMALTMTLEENGKKEKMLEFINHYQQDDKSFKTVLRIFDDITGKESLGFDMEGALHSEKEGKDLSCDIQKLAIQIDGNSLVTLSGSYKLKAEAVVIEEPAGEELDIFKVTEQQWADIMEEAGSKIMGLYFSLYSMYS